MTPAEFRSVGTDRSDTPRSDRHRRGEVPAGGPIHVTTPPHENPTSESNGGPDSPLAAAKRYDEPSVFTPESLVEAARRQKDLPERSVPDVCVLDPDGDIVRHLVSTGRAEADATWPGYHTELYRFERDGEEFGIVGGQSVRSSQSSSPNSCSPPAVSFS